jgi:hypothetical protein
MRQHSPRGMSVKELKEYAAYLEHRSIFGF